MQEAMPGTAGLADLLIVALVICLRGGGRAELRDRESGLPAAAQQPQAGAADHRHRHVDPAADAGHDHLEAELQALSRRCCRHARSRSAAP